MSPRQMNQRSKHFEWPEWPHDLDPQRLITSIIIVTALILLSQLNCFQNLAVDDDLRVLYHSTTPWRTAERYVLDLKRLRRYVEYEPVALRLGSSQRLRNSCTYGEKYLRARDFLFKSDGGEHSTWPDLLQEVNSMYARNLSGRYGCNNVARDHDTTEPVVACRDSRPPFGDKPMVVTSLQDLLVFAVRLGMQWRQVQPKAGYLEAEGNGFRIKSTRSYQRDPVVHFIHVEKVQRKKFPALISTRTVDKMICGVIPGDYGLGLLDFEIRGVSSSMWLHYARRSSMWDRHVDEQRTVDSICEAFADPTSPTSVLLGDLLALVTPFLPTQNLQHRDVVAPFIFEYSKLWSAFGSWRSSAVLLQSLRDIVSDLDHISGAAMLGEALDSIANVHEGTSRECANEVGSRSQKPSHLDALRRAHSSTATYLRDFSKNFNVSSNTDSATISDEDMNSVLSSDQDCTPNLFLILLAAHIKLTYHVYSSSEQDHEPDEALANRYLDELEYFRGDVRSGITRWQPDGTTILSDGEITLAWCSLVLRGASWSMSVSITMPEVRFPMTPSERLSRVWIE